MLLIKLISVYLSKMPRLREICMSNTRPANQLKSSDYGDHWTNHAQSGLSVLLEVTCSRYVCHCRTHLTVSKGMHIFCILHILHTQIDESHQTRDCLPRSEKTKFHPLSANHHWTLWLHAALDSAGKLLAVSPFICFHKTWQWPQRKLCLLNTVCLESAVR